VFSAYAGSVNDRVGWYRTSPLLAIAIKAGYTVVHYVALALSRADLLPALLAAWTANVIFLGLAASLFLRPRT
jgi:lipopolysaccharide export LptBFGC system permease protein LptF